MADNRFRKQRGAIVRGNGLDFAAEVKEAKIRGFTVVNTAWGAILYDPTFTAK